MMLEMGESYWLWQAEECFAWSDIEADMRWEQFGYYYLFKALGYDGGM